MRSSLVSTGRSGLLIASAPVRSAGSLEVNSDTSYLVGFFTLGATGLLTRSFCGDRAAEGTGDAAVEIAFGGDPAGFMGVVFLLLPLELALAPLRGLLLELDVGLSGLVAWSPPSLAAADGSSMEMKLLRLLGRLSGRSSSVPSATGSAAAEGMNIDIKLPRLLDRLVGRSSSVPSASASAAGLNNEIKLLLLLGRLSGRSSSAPSALASAAGEEGLNIEMKLPRLLGRLSGLSCPGAPSLASAEGAATDARSGLEDRIHR